MRLILALLLCFALPAVAQMPGLNPGRDPRLPVPVAHPPWHAVALLEAEGIGICTGAMLAPAVLLTAAHCLKDAAGTALLPPALLACSGAPVLQLPIPAVPCSLTATREALAAGRETATMPAPAVARSTAHYRPASYNPRRPHETNAKLVCRPLLEKQT